ncbi:cysteine desulfurase [Georgenia wutianyii]|uniref:Cysteine desulfurase n=1 Tax=Georgenia wutianyii TaxID=2585135 RepID=A0ABX5VNE1_9MICO|nr:cysteine desulfurase family protein [Georgenia wutianyii]QDB80029.1 cysteine desulfurase [Georgenia wutianyii]
MHYLDHAATTPVRPEVVEVYAEELAGEGNPSSLHGAGRSARRRLEEAREEIAAALGAEPAEVLFTSGGTEADNLAVKGAVYAHPSPRPRLLVSAVEHHAVLDAAAWLGEQGLADVAFLPVTGEGTLDLDAARELLAQGEAPALVSVMWANNETGVVQPVEDVVALAGGAPVHSDAVQAVAHLPVDFGASGLAAMSLTGHKLGGPVGTGALLARRDLALAPVHHGGGQERGVRSGTLDVAGARALARAVTLAVADREAENARLAALRDRLVAGALAAVDGLHLTGEHAPRLPHVAHFTVEGADADSLLFGLDTAGIAASAGSACQAGVQEPSFVLVAMGYPAGLARSALRFSLGRTTTEADVDAALAVLPDVVARSRAANATRAR